MIREAIRRWWLSRKLFNALYRLEMHQFLHGQLIAGRVATERLVLQSNVASLRAASETGRYVASVRPVGQPVIGIAYSAATASACDAIEEGYTAATRAASITY